MKILFTGMGSHHCKRPSNVSFFSTLDDILSEVADVTWASPSMSWTKQYLESYDQIIFGFTPPTSLSANKIYGAMNVLALMFDSPKLKLIVDSPQIWQYKNSIAAVTKNPDILFGNFYSKREGYDTALRNKSVIEKAAAHMLVSEWPEIIYPALPWSDNNKISKLLGFGTAGKISGVSVDPVLINPAPARIGRQDYWALENPKSAWAETIQKSISLPIELTKYRRNTDDEYAFDVIQNSTGLLLPPQDRNVITWWNYRLIQALNSSTPVVTYWEDTINFNTNWAMLAYQIEDMSPSQRQVLASTQRNVYLEALPPIDESKHLVINSLLNYSKERM